MSEEKSIEIQDDRTLSRKQFMRRVALAGVATQLPWIIACDEESREKVAERRDLDLRQSVLDILLPSDALGPGALDVYADSYIEWVLKDELVDEEDRSRLIKGFDMIAQYAAEQGEEPFEKWPLKQQEALVAQLAVDEEWGKDWLARLISLSFEAMFALPIYGSNPDEKGWAWVEWNAGRPRPEGNLKYPEYLNTVRNG